MLKTKHPISVVIITFNVADTIGPCLEALQKVSDDILVLDSFSNDGTVEICKKMGIRPLPQPWLGFSKTKNIGHQLAKNDWILSIDSDEVLSDELIASLQKWVPQPGHVYSFDRLTNFCGKWIRHSGWYPEWKVRLFDRNHVYWQGDFVHETLHIPPHYQETKLTGKLYHYSYKDKNDHFQRIKKYARLSAQERFANGKTPSFAGLWLSPIARFVRTYFLKKGFLDGQAGFLIAWRSGYMVHLRHAILKDLWKTKNTR